MSASVVLTLIAALWLQTALWGIFGKSYGREEAALWCGVLAIIIDFLIFFVLLGQLPKAG